jgi:uncharacterized YccA/Bax inhibitor family protein
MRTSNPAFGAAFADSLRTRTAGEPMTLAGTATKTLVLMALTVAAAGYMWSHAGTAALTPLLLTGCIAGFLVALVTIFRPQVAPFTAPLYAVLEGVALGAASWLYNQRYHGLPMQAVGLTLGVALAMAVLYRTGLLRASPTLTRVVVGATGGIAVFYLLSLLVGMFGITMPLINSAGPFGIVFSVGVVIVAALNLTLDFGQIETAVAARAPGYMEWYGAFSLLVTCVWLYLEMLRLMSKLQKR